jgi:hypothetical protein
LSQPAASDCLSLLRHEGLRLRLFFLLDIAKSGGNLRRHGLPGILPTGSAHYKEEDYEKEHILADAACGILSASAGCQRGACCH